MRPRQYPPTSTSQLTRSGLAAASAMATAPPWETLSSGKRSRSHRPATTVTAIYVLSGRVEVYSGPDLDDHQVCEAGDFVFTPSGLVHAPRNTSDTEPAYLVAATGDPGEHEHTVMSG